MVTGFLDLKTPMTLNHLKPPPPQKKVFSDSWQFLDRAHILTLNCDEIAEDRPRQPEYEIFSIKRTF